MNESELNNLIKPEIIEDELAFIIEQLASRPDVKTILEIGSSSGEGSTAAFYKGITGRKEVYLFCLEVSETRFDKLLENYPEKEDCNMMCFNMASIVPFEYPSIQEVTHFYHNVSTVLNKYPLEEVLRWLKQDLDYIDDNIIEVGGIDYIKESYSYLPNGLDTFDLVLIDGSEFTGFVELQKIIGSKIIVLDDINSFKNYNSYQYLAKDKSYQLTKENWELRNGFAIFEKVI
jgi:hypothetical protein